MYSSVMGLQVEQELNIYLVPQRAVFVQWLKKWMVQQDES